MLRTETQTNERSLYTILQIPSTASTEEVRSAYKKAARRTHPDAYFVKQGEFEEVNKAYTVLTNRKNRILYNAFGDVILPILLDQRYAPYIETLLSKKTVVISIFVVICLLLSTLFYPYLVLLAALHILPWFTLTLIPHFIVYVASSLIMYRLTLRQMRYKVLEHMITAGLFLGLAVGVCLYVDGFIKAESLGMILATTEVFHILNALLKNFHYRKISPDLSVFEATAGDIAKSMYIFALALRTGQCLTFIFASSRYVRALPFPLYVLALFISQSMGVIGIAPFIVSLIFGMFIAFVSSGNLGVVGWTFVIGFLIGISAVLARICVRARHMLGKESWKNLAIEPRRLSIPEHPASAV